MKKILALLLALVFAFSALSVCADDDEYTVVVERTAVPIARDGCYVNSSGLVRQQVNYAIRQDFELKAGQKLLFNATGAGRNVAVLAMHEGDTYTPLISSEDDYEHTYEYSTDRDVTVTISSKSNMTVFKKILALPEGQSASRVTDLSSFTVVEAQSVLGVAQEGRFVNSIGRIGEHANFSIRKDIVLGAGQSLAFNARGSANNVAILAQHIGDKYVPLIVAADDEEHDYVYTAPSDMALTISSRSNMTVHVQIVTGTILQGSSSLSVSEYDPVAFVTMGVIGDGLAAGASDYRGNVVTKPAYSWGKYIEREHGIAVSLFAADEATTKSWLKESYGKAVLLAADPLDCYVIGLGVNDAATLGDKYLGTAKDIHVGIEDVNGDTFYGNYAQIIAIIKSKAPRAKIFLLTDPKAEKADWNEAVKKIASMYEGCYAIDLTDDPFYLTDLFKTSWFYAHSTALGYKLIAQNIYSHIGEIVREKPEEFTEIQLIGEN